MEPTEKSPVIEKFLDMVSRRRDAIQNDRCVNPPIGCGKPADEFRDRKSKEEYRISGLCQICQDSVFGRDDV